MLRNETKARETRCCGPEGCGALGTDGRYCIAAACMAWRWALADTTPPDIVRKYTTIPNVKTLEEARAVPRPADIPSTWKIANPPEIGAFAWIEPAVDFDARKEAEKIDWPLRRRGFCGLAPLVLP